MKKAFAYFCVAVIATVAFFYWKILPKCRKVPNTNASSGKSRPIFT